MNTLPHILPNDSLAIRRRNGVYGIMQLIGHPGLFLHDDGRTKPASEKAFKEALALCEKWNLAYAANQKKKLDKASR